MSPVSFSAQPDRGPWIQTATGRAYYPLTPRADEVFIEDIAASLSKLCRWGGHCKAFYSVAEHSVHVASLLPQHLKLQGLLHDAHEAYLGDMMRPVKEKIADYDHLCYINDTAIFDKFGLPLRLSPEVDVADNAMLVAERDQIMLRPPIEWKPGMPAAAEITCGGWAPHYAERRFLMLFRKLTEVSV